MGYFIYGKIYHPKMGGNVFRERGITSGSFFTNIIGGIANLLMNIYTMDLNKVDYSKININVCGDDNLIVTDYKFNVNQHARTLNTTFNVLVTYPIEYQHGPESECLGHFLGSL